MSNKMTREKMLEELDRCWVIPLEKGAAVKDIWESSGFKARDAIRALIREHRPEVSEEWLRQKAGELSTHRFSNQHPEIAHDWLCRTFRELHKYVKTGKF